MRSESGTHDPLMLSLREASELVKALYAAYGPPGIELGRALRQDLNFQVQAVHRPKGA
ncbi:MAG: hypothetical protein KIS61_33100 [Candidatus Eremiobacteraeota bacterium]|nr:hypothetical protein [Candidatus Eremiobacteraeota bacterium]